MLYEGLNTLDLLISFYLIGLSLGLIMLSVMSHLLVSAILLTQLLCLSLLGLFLLTSLNRGCSLDSELSSLELEIVLSIECHFHLGGG